MESTCPVGRFNRFERWGRIGIAPARQHRRAHTQRHQHRGGVPHRRAPAGDAEIINAEFAKVSTEEVWRQLFIPAETAATAKRNRTELLVVMGLALLGGLSFKVPALFGLADIDAHALVYLRNAALFAFFPVAWYFIYKRSLDVVHSLPALGLFVLGALVVNLYPAKEPSDTAFLAAIHLPIAFLFLLIFFYGGPSLPGREIDQKPRQKTGWRNANTRLNFVRFAGGDLHIRRIDRSGWGWC